MRVRPSRYGLIHPVGMTMSSVPRFNLDTLLLLLALEIQYFTRP